MRLFCGMAWGPDLTGNAGLWFRICGYGLHVCTRKREQALFSERYGHRRALYLFWLRFEYLPRDKGV